MTTSVFDDDSILDFDSLEPLCDNLETKDSHPDYGTNVYLFDRRDPETLENCDMKRIYAWIARSLYPHGTRCQHEYDCCGHIYVSRVKIQDGDHRFVVVTQDYSRNI